MKLSTSDQLVTMTPSNRQIGQYNSFTTIQTGSVPVSGGQLYGDFFYAPYVDGFTFFTFPPSQFALLESSIFASAVSFQYEGFFTPGSTTNVEWDMYLTVGEINNDNGFSFTPLQMWQLPPLKFNVGSGLFTQATSLLEQRDFDWTNQRQLACCVCFDIEQNTNTQNTDIFSAEMKATVSIGQILKGLI